MERCKLTVQWQLCKYGVVIFKTTKLKSLLGKLVVFAGAAVQLSILLPCI